MIAQLHGYELDEKRCGECGDLIDADGPTHCYPCRRQLERKQVEDAYWRELTGTCQGYRGETQ